MANSDPFQLFLFATDPEIISIADRTDIHGYIVDLESSGKEVRQLQYDTQISKATLQDLHRVRSSTERPLICRINGFSDATREEIENVLGAGADEVFLPMVTTSEQVTRTLDLLRDRCPLSILVETLEAVRQAESLGQLPLARVYVGLNDLAIDRGIKNIFTAVVDGTVAQVRRHFRVPFGFGGLTLPDMGSPIPCRLLIGEMMRLDCQFSFLRRSFYRDIRDRDMEQEVPRLLEAIAASRSRTEEQKLNDKDEFASCVTRWADGSFVGGD